MINTRRLIIKEKDYNEQQYLNIMNKNRSTKRKVTMILGLTLVGVGVVTLPVPCGSIQMIGIGGLLISNPETTIKKICNKLKWNVITKIKMRKNK